MGTKLANRTERRGRPVARMPDVAYQRIADCIPAAMFVTDRRDRIVHANQPSCHVLGRRRRSLLGRRVADVLPGRAATAGPVDEFETVVPSRAGQRWLTCRVARFRDDHGSRPGWRVWVVSDVTELRQRQQLTEGDAAHLELAQVAAHLGSWEWELHTNRITWSPQLYRIFQLEPGDAPVDLGTYLEFVHPDDRAFVEQTIERVLRRRTRMRFQHRIVTADGQVRRLHCQGMGLLDGSGEVARMVGTAIDLTDAGLDPPSGDVPYLMEREQLAAERLHQLDSMKTVFLSAVSHELRTPLTSITGLARTLVELGAQLDERQRDECMQRILDESERLDALLADVLDLQRAGALGRAARREHVDVAALARSRAQQLCERNGREVRVVAAPRVEGLVEGDKVERILDNLLSNADKYSPPDRPVTVCAERREDGVLVRVDDEGAGVPGELKRHIFEPFERHVVDRVQPGFGIGLSLVATFARMHGGSAWVEDRVGGGSSFRVWLPDSTGTSWTTRPTRVGSASRTWFTGPREGAVTAAADPAPEGRSEPVRGGRD